MLIIESLCFNRIILPNPPTGSDIRATTPAAADFIRAPSSAAKSSPSFLLLTDVGLYFLRILPLTGLINLIAET